MSKFRVDTDAAGNAEVSPQKPRKLRPMDDEEATAPKSAIKSALKGGARVSPTPPASTEKKSALKSALKSSAPPLIPEPDEEPAAAPAPKSALKSAMKRRDPPPEEQLKLTPKPPPGKPKAKSALKSRAPASVEQAGKPSSSAYGIQRQTSEANYSSEASEMSMTRTRSKGGTVYKRCTQSRPSVYKMTIDLPDGQSWTARGICRHYFHFVAQAQMWEQAMKEIEAKSGSKQRKSIRVAELVLPKSLTGLTGEPDTTFAPAGSIKADHGAISPLKDLFLAKKPDGARVRQLLKDMSPDDVKKWVNTSLDSTPPPMPAPLFFAVAGVQSHLVEVLIDFGVDVTAQYPGKSMLKGWVKPNTPLEESVHGRKGRFLGTMLGDKLDAIEGMLRKALSKGKDEPEPPPPAPNIRRKSVQMKCIQGVMEHTHDHPSSRYELVAHHDDGNPSNVREAINIESGEVYAIKAGNKIDEASPTDPEAALWNEIGIIRKLDHPNIVRLHETFENDTHIFMVLEGCLGGELFDRLVSEGSVGEEAGLRLAYQIGSGLRHLHQIQICHRDVQPEAFFLAEAGPLIETGVKLIDFSSAREFSSDQRMYTKVCTLHYVAPEIVSSVDGYTEKVDIWSFGVLLYTMICGTQPFHCDNELDTLALIKDGKFDFAPAEKWNTVGEDAKDLIKRCLTVEAAKRPDFWGIMEHSCMVQAEASGAIYTASEKLGREDKRNVKNASNIVKAAFFQMAEIITDDQVEELRQLFIDLDDDNHGMVELEECVESLGEMLQDNADAVELLKVLAAGGMSGRVNYLMYMATMTDRRRQLRREAARAVFNNFDIDKNGHISWYEISQALNKHDEICLKKVTSVSNKEVQKIWSEMKAVFVVQYSSSKPGQDVKPDTEMSFDEFFKLLPSSSKWDIGF